MNKNKLSDMQIKEFWKEYSRFYKTGLNTETPHPKTYNLSQLAQSNLTQALQLFQELELETIEKIKENISSITELQQSINNCFKNNNKVFLIGCGASGRLCMLLKRLWELSNPDNSKQIISICAAGDVSLIKSIEQFEDKPDFGIKQLLQQGFSKNDLLIGLTASGESPFILAAISHAAKISRYKPWLVFNNSISSLLLRNPKHIVNTHDIQSLALNIGPMALTGSTRLQATSAMQVALGLALLHHKNNDFLNEIDNIYNTIKSFPLINLAPITDKETEIFLKKEFILYETNDIILGLNLLADLTERSPTFNLPPFENNNKANQIFSPFYLSLTNIKNSKEAWNFLLGQDPICLNWENFPKTTLSYIEGFDLSKNSLRATSNYLPSTQHREVWQIKNNLLKIQLDDIYVKFQIIPQNILLASLIYKLCLNAHSTIMMGRVGNFEGNLMLSLNPTNFKLIDRAIRYSQFLLKKHHNLNIDYKVVAEVTFQEIENLKPNESIVKKVVNRFLVD